MGKGGCLKNGQISWFKGPGIFFIVPIIDQISSLIDQRVRVTEFRLNRHYKRHCPGKCRCSCLLDGVGCGKSST